MSFLASGGTVLRQIVIVISVWGLSTSAIASPISILIDTASFGGTQASVAFDFIDGGLPASSVLLTDISTDGLLEGSTSLGAVMGNYPGPVVLSDSAFFNELFLDVTLNSFVSFTFNVADVNPGPIPDSFSVYLLERLTGLPLFATTDPNLTDALLRFDMGSDHPDIFQATDGRVTVEVVQPTVVPEPASLLMLSTGLIGFATSRLCRRRTRRS